MGNRTFYGKYTSQRTGKQYSLVRVHCTVRYNCKILSWPLQVAPRVVTLQIRLESINQPVVATLFLGVILDPRIPPQDSVLSNPLFSSRIVVQVSSIPFWIVVFKDIVFLLLVLPSGPHCTRDFISWQLSD